MDSLSTSFTIDGPDDFIAVDETRHRPEGLESHAAGPGAGWRELLIRAGMRLTRQRVILSELLFANGDRHVTAEALHAEALAADAQISLATVYNTLNQFTQAGLLRRIGPDGSRSFFDTNTSPHPHYYLQGEDILLDVPEADLAVANMPQPLPGHEVSRLDVIIHLRRKRS